MTATTLFGLAGGEGTIAEYRCSGSGQLLAADWYEALDLELRAGGTPVDVGHDADQTIGRLVYAELDPDARLHCVVVVDEEPETIRRLGNLYFSGTYAVIAAAGERGVVSTVERARLLGLSLVRDPANWEAARWPLRALPGDVRSAADRSSWSVGWQVDAPLVARAVGHRGHLELRSAGAGRIVDRRDHYGPYDPDDYRSACRGAIEHSGHRGRILSVR